MNNISFFSLFVMLLASKASDKVTNYQMPPDWYPQQGVFVNYSGPEKVDDISRNVHKVCQEIVKELSAVTKVYVHINEGVNQDSLRQLFSGKGIRMDSEELVQVYKLFSTGVPRDYGPIIVKDTAGNNKLLRFHWDYVGADFSNPDSLWGVKREEIRDRYFEQMSQLLKMEVIRSPVALEGGEIEVNGKGTAILVDSFNLKRNPSFFGEPFAKQLKKKLGIKKIIWLREGVVEDPPPGPRSKIGKNLYGYGVGGHIDEFARFANATTVLLAMPTRSETETDSLKKINFKRMQVNYDILKNSSDQDGKPLKIVFVPVPDVHPDTFVVDTSRMDFPLSALANDFPEWDH